jgi:hypothetical protein
MVSSAAQSKMGWPDTYPPTVKKSPIIIMRDNGVTVYDSKDGAEASMEWADVERNPTRRAFDAQGIEFAFKRAAAHDHAAPFHRLWNARNPIAVELESTSIIPQPGKFRDALIHWLAGKGIQVEPGIDLETLILLASRTKHGRPAVTSDHADHGGSSLRVATTSDLRRIAEREEPPRDAASR